MLSHSGGVVGVGGGGFAKRASIPLASAPSRWWECGAPGGGTGSARGGGEARERKKKSANPGEKNKRLVGVLGRCSRLFLLLPASLIRGEHKQGRTKEN